MTAVAPPRERTLDLELPLARLAPLAVGALTLLAAMLTIGSWPVGVFQDDGIYVILAKSLATGQGYRYLNIPGHPAATHYPPGYPALLALLWRLDPSFPDNVAVFKFANAVLLAVAAVGCYRFALARPRLSAPASAVTTIAALVSIPVLMLTGIVLSEPLFLALLFPTLHVCECAAEDGDARYAIGAGVLGGVLALVRTLGVVAIPATAIVLLARRRVRPAILVLAAGALTLAPWQLWVHAHEHDVPAVLMGKYGSYGAWLAGGFRGGGVPFALGVVRENVVGLTGRLWVVFSAGWGGVWTRAACELAIAAFVTLGLARARRLTPVTALFVVFYIGLVMAWPFAPDRFVWGIWPLVALLFTLGAASAAPLRAPTTAMRTLRVVALACAALVVVGYAAYNARAFRGHWWDSLQREGALRARPLAEWVLKNTRPGDAIATDDDALIYLYTGREAVTNGTFTPAEYLRPQAPSEGVHAMREIVARYPVHFVLVSTVGTSEAARALARTAPAVLRPVAPLAGGAVYERAR